MYHFVLGIISGMALTWIGLHTDIGQEHFRVIETNDG